MSVVRVQHGFQGSSNLPEDQYVNTWYFDYGDVHTPQSLAALGAIVQNFYTTTPAGQTDSISDYMGGLADSVGAYIKMYELNDPIPRPIIYQNTYTPQAFGANSPNLPQELAVCMSYQATSGTGTIRRRRGRLYLGPFQAIASTANAGGTNDARVNPDLRTLITEAAAKLRTDAAAIQMVWVVYSQTASSGQEIDRVWVDDAWDVQRRRGLKPSTRTGINF